MRGAWERRSLSIKEGEGRGVRACRPECSDVLQSRGCENRGFCKEDDRLFKPECFLRVSRGIRNLDRLPGALIVHRLSVEAWLSAFSSCFYSCPVDRKDSSSAVCSMAWTSDSDGGRFARSTAAMHEHLQCCVLNTFYTFCMKLQ